jgi:hypothetical protein
MGVHRARQTSSKTDAPLTPRRMAPARRGERKGGAQPRPVARGDGEGAGNQHRAAAAGGGVAAGVTLRF